MIPYTIIKNAIRIANPAAVMSSILDIFLAQPFGARSLMQRIFSLTLNDGIRSFQKSIDSLVAKVGEPIFCEKLKKFTDASEEVKNAIRTESDTENVDLIVAILRSEDTGPALNSEQIGKIYNAWVAWNNAVDNVDEEMKQGAQLFSYLKQLLKLYTRQRDKAMMLSMIEEPVTLQLLRDLFTIFYEPLVRVYKSANVYNSVTDFAVFIDDMIQVISTNSLYIPLLIENFRSSTNAANKTSPQIPTKQSKLSSTSANATNTTSTNSSTKSTPTTTAYSASSWAGSKASSSFCAKVLKRGN
jgi:hypothetical protein